VTAMALMFEKALPLTVSGTRAAGVDQS